MESHIGLGSSAKSFRNKEEIGFFFLTARPSRLYHRPRYWINKDPGNNFPSNQASVHGHGVLIFISGKKKRTLSLICTAHTEAG